MHKPKLRWEIVTVYYGRANLSKTWQYKQTATSIAATLDIHKLKFVVRSMAIAVIHMNPSGGFEKHEMETFRSAVTILLFYLTRLTTQKLQGQSNNWLVSTHEYTRNSIASWAGGDVKRNFDVQKRTGGTYVELSVPVAWLCCVLNQERKCPSDVVRVWTLIKHLLVSISACLTQISLRLLADCLAFYDMLSMSN